MKKVLLVLVLLAIGFIGVFAQNDAQAHFNRGVTHFENGQYDQAIAAFTEVIRLAPNNVNGYYNRGVAYKNKGDYDRAIADYSEAIRLNPNYAGAYSNRGNAYYSKRDYDRAIADYDHALRINPNHANAKTNRDIAIRAKNANAGQAETTGSRVNIDPPENRQANPDPIPQNFQYPLPLISNLQVGMYYIQIGSYGNINNAYNEVAKNSRSFPVAVMRATVIISGIEKDVYRVLIGPLNYSESNILLQQLRVNYRDAFVWTGRLSPAQRTETPPPPPNPSITIVNNTGYTIIELYIQPKKTGPEKLEEIKSNDITRDKPLADGQSIEVTLPFNLSDINIYDIYLRDTDGDDYYKGNISVTANSRIIFTIGDWDDWW